MSVFPHSEGEEQRKYLDTVRGGQRESLVSVRPQEGVGTAGDSVSDTLQRRRVLEGWLAAWRPGRAGRGEPSLTSPCAAPRPGEAAEVGKALEDAPQHRQLRDVHRALWRGQGRQWESKAHSTAPGNEESPFSGI